MEIVNCYKGVFCLGHYKRSGIDEDYLLKFNDAIENHKRMIYEDAKNAGHNIDTVIATYNLSQDYLNLISKIFPTSIITLSDLDPSSDTWAAQIFHYEKIIDAIKIMENDLGKRYDLVMTNRFDARFNQNLMSLNIDTEKFNIIFQHLSGNCDDNFWVFPRNYLEIFERSISEISRSRMITHQMNHAIASNGGEVHYMYDHVDVPSNLGHTVFELVR